MTNIEKVMDYLDKAKVFYVTTEDGDKPKCRPFSFKMIYDGKICFGCGTFKDVYKQLTANPNVEICAFDGSGNFLRYYGKAAFLEDPDAEKAALEVMPGLKNIYNVKTGRHLGVFCLEDATAEFRSLFKVEEALEM